ncbi:hypothetical protein BJ875DRAFT_503134 [Amylocarpus encephaloides]|uniref:Rhodopsin domain-containing protein n=1 Tax=Amylocarpus encephaloides TaxID=45428 RepID=A0A9P8C7Z4_9HELO|nr:hypothetical protein BJ875DRAFT_503134 [Amylocarpus encephaloides]
MVIQYFVGSHLNEAPDLTYYLTPIIYWPMIEAALGVVAACLPTLRPLFKGWSIESFMEGVRSTFTLRSTTGSAWERTGGSRDDVESASQSSSVGFNKIYKPNNDSTKLETNIEIVPLEEVKIHRHETGGIMVQKNFKQVDEAL